MSIVKAQNFTTIQGWMLTELKLKGNELLIFAIIYGFSQADGQVFSGSLRYLADWTNSTKQGVMKNLKSLVEKGYLAKREVNVNGVRFCEYRATVFAGVCNKVYRGGEEKLPGGMQQSSPNNIDINNKEDIKKERKKEVATYDEIIKEEISDSSVEEALVEFIKMRKFIKKPLTDYALKRIIKKLDDLGGNDNKLKVDILNQSIVNNWQGLFPLKKYDDKKEPKDDERWYKSEDGAEKDEDWWPLYL